MVKIYVIVALFGLIGRTNADKNDWFAALKESVQEMKQSLSKDQLDGIHSMRVRVGQFPGVNFDEPIPNLDRSLIYTAISEYLDDKEHLKGNDNMLGRKEIFEKEFYERIAKPCDIFYDIMGSSLLDFYMNEAFGVMTFKDVQDGNKDELEMLLDAGFCRKVTDHDTRKTIDESYKRLMSKGSRSPGSSLV